MKHLTCVGDGPRLVRRADGRTPAEIETERADRRMLFAALETASPDTILEAVTARVADDPDFDAVRLGDRIARIGWDRDRHADPTKAEGAA